MNAGETALTTHGKSNAIKSDHRRGGWRVWRRTSSQTAESYMTTEETPSHATTSSLAAPVGCGVWPFTRRTSLFRETDGVVALKAEGSTSVVLPSAVGLPLELRRFEQRAPVPKTDRQTSEVFADDPSHSEVSHDAPSKAFEETTKRSDASTSMTLHDGTHADVLEKEMAIESGTASPASDNMEANFSTDDSQVEEEDSATTNVAETIASEESNTVVNYGVDVVAVSSVVDSSLSQSPDDVLPRKMTSEGDHTTSAPTGQRPIEEDTSAKEVVDQTPVDLALNDVTSPDQSSTCDIPPSLSHDDFHQVDTPENNNGNALSSFDKVGTLSPDQDILKPTEPAADKVAPDRMLVEQGEIFTSFIGETKGDDAPVEENPVVDNVELTDDAGEVYVPCREANGIVTHDSQGKMIQCHNHAVIATDMRDIESLYDGCQSNPVTLTTSPHNDSFDRDDDFDSEKDDLEQTGSESEFSDGSDVDVVTATPKVDGVDHSKKCPENSSAADTDSEDSGHGDDHEDKDVDGVNLAKKCLENSSADDQNSENSSHDDDDGDNDVDMLEDAGANLGLDQSCHTHVETGGNWHVDADFDVDTDVDDSSVLTDDDGNEVVSKADDDESESSVDDYSDDCDEDNEDESSPSDGGDESIGDEEYTADVNRGLSFGDASFVIKSSVTNVSGINAEHFEQDLEDGESPLSINDDSLDIAEHANADDEKKGRMLTRRGVQRQPTGDSLKELQASATASADKGENIRRGGRRKAATGIDSAASEKETETTAESNCDTASKVPILTRRGVQRQATGDSLQLLHASVSGIAEATSVPVEPKRRGGRRKATSEVPSIDATTEGVNDEQKGPLLTRRGVQRQSTGDSLQLLQASASGGPDSTPTYTESKRRGGRRAEASTPTGSTERSNCEHEAEDAGDKTKKGPMLTRRGVQRHPTGDSLQELQARASRPTDATSTPIESKRRGGRKKVVTSDSDKPSAIERDETGNEDGEMKGPMLNRRGLHRQATGDSVTFGMLVAGATSCSNTPDEPQSRGGRRKAASTSEADEPTLKHGSEATDAAFDANKKPMLTRRGVQRQATGDSLQKLQTSIGSPVDERSTPIEAKKRGGRRRSAATLEDDAAACDEQETRTQCGGKDEKKEPMLTRRGLQRQATGDRDTFDRVQASVGLNAAITPLVVEAPRRGGRRKAAPTPGVDEAASESNKTAVEDGDDDEKKDPMLTRRGVQRQATGDSVTFGLLVAGANDSSDTIQPSVEPERRGGRRVKSNCEQTDTFIEPQHETSAVDSNDGAAAKTGTLLTRRGIERQSTGDSDTLGLLQASVNVAPSEVESKRRGGRRKAPASSTGNEATVQGIDDAKTMPLLTRRGVQRQSTGDSATFGLLIGSASDTPAESKRRGGRRMVASSSENDETAVEKGNDMIDEKKVPLLTRRGVQRQSTGDSDTWGPLQAGAIGSPEATKPDPIISVRRVGRRKVASASDMKEDTAQNGTSGSEYEPTTDEIEVMITQKEKRQPSGDIDGLDDIPSGSGKVVVPLDDPTFRSTCDHDESSNSNDTSPFFNDEAGWNEDELHESEDNKDVQKGTPVIVSDIGFENDTIDALCVDGQDKVSEALARLCCENRTTVGNDADETRVASEMTIGSPSAASNLVGGAPVKTTPRALVDSGPEPCLNDTVVSTSTSVWDDSTEPIDQVLTDSTGSVTDDEGIDELGVDAIVDDFGKEQSPFSDDVTHCANVLSDEDTGLHTNSDKDQSSFSDHEMTEVVNLHSDSETIPHILQ